MALKVQVPMDFGRHHIGSRPHSSMTLNMKDGKVMKVSSLILSYNSPVIEKLTSTLEITSLDVDDFQDSAVECFVDCVYTGGIELLDKSVFRDANKLAHVFEVEWLVGRCCDYFSHLLGQVSHDNFDEMLFFVEEAVFVMTTLKKEGLRNIVISRINNLDMNDEFICKYILKTDDLDSLTTSRLDMVIMIADKQLGILIKLLLSNIKKNAAISSNAKYLLQRLDLISCFYQEKELCLDLFDALNDLDNLPNEELKLVSKLQLQTLKSCKSLKTTQSLDKGPNVRHIGYFFRSLEPIGETNFSDFHSQLSHSPSVKNLYMYLDRLFTWMERKSIRSWNNEWTKSICNLKEDRGWKMVSKSFISRWGLSEQVCGLVGQGLLDLLDEMKRPIIVRPSAGVCINLFFANEQCTGFTVENGAEMKCFTLKTTPISCDEQTYIKYEIFKLDRSDSLNYLNFNEEKIYFHEFQLTLGYLRRNKTAFTPTHKCSLGEVTHNYMQNEGCNVWKCKDGSTLNGTGEPTFLLFY